MGYKIAGVLGVLLLIAVSGSAWWIDRLQDNISTLKANSIVLETQIQNQNDAIEKHLQRAENLQAQNDKLNAQNQETVREVNRLRNTFANHDLDALALAKPGLIESKVNKAVKRLKNELEELTDPNQFDDDEEDSNS